MNAIRVFLRDIRVEHTLFALPFAYVGAVMAARGLPAWWQLFWITLAVIGARTAAMAANRYFDRELDAQVPRTAQRALASGVVVYPLLKRFTWLVHFVLGAVDACAPLGAYVAVAGVVTVPALLLFVAVTVWVAGFDILYALMDLPWDRKLGVRSFPAQFGERNARLWAILLHATMTLALFGAGFLAHAGWLYYGGVALAAGVTLYEDRLIGFAKDIFVLNERVFVTNMIFSVAFLGTTLASYIAR